MATKNNETNLESAQPQPSFVEKNAKALIIGVAAIIVIIAGYFCYTSFIAGPREDKASTAIAKGQDYFNQEQFDKALNGDGAGYVGFVKIASDYSSTDAGNLANLYAGLSYANLGKWQDAVKYLEKYSPAGDAMVSPAAVQALGNAYAHVGQTDKAISCLKEAASKADKKAKNGVNYSISPSFMLQAAQLLESQKKTEEALNIYKEIKTKYINSALVQSHEIDKYIERATK